MNLKFSQPVGRSYSVVWWNRAVLTGQVKAAQEEKEWSGYIHGFRLNLLLSCQILSVPLLTDASDIYMGSSFSPKCDLKTGSQSGVESEKSES